MEKDLLNYQVGTIQGECPMDKEIEQAKAFISSEHKRKLKEELPYIRRYFETLPMDLEEDYNDSLSESSVGSYEAREEWDEKEYRQLMLNFNRNQAKCTLDKQVKELAIQRDPGNVSAIEKEYSENMERLDYRQKRGQDLMRVAKSFADYVRRQGNLRRTIRQEEVKKLQEGTEWRSQEERLIQEMQEQLERQTFQLQQKEKEWAEKIKQQKELSQQLESKYKDMKELEGKQILELQNQYRENQRKTEKYWSDFTNTWAAEKICKDDKIDKLNSALEVDHEQQLAIEQRWKNAVEEEKKEKLAQVNQLIERVNGMEVKQSEIRQNKEQKLRAVQEKVQEKYQRNVKMMQEDYQKKT